MIPNFIARRDGWAKLILSISLLSATCGCVVIEEQTLVADLADTTDEVRFLYLFEGISAGTHSKAQSHAVDSIASGIIHPAQLPFHFAMGQQATDYSSPDFLPSLPRLIEQFQSHTVIEPLEYFYDDSRGRPLCAEQRVTIGHRDEIIDTLNAVFQEYFNLVAQATTEELVAKLDLLQTDEARKALEAQEKQWEAQLQQFGLGAFSAFPLAGIAILEHLDEASIEHAREAVAAGHVWLRHTTGALELVVPITPTCAQAVVQDDNTRISLNEIRRVVSPVRLEPRPEGIAIILGAEGKPLVCKGEDRRPHDASFDKELLVAAGGHSLLKWRGLHRDGPARIDLFLRRSAAPIRTWKSSDGTKSVDASLEELDNEVVKLKRTDNGQTVPFKIEQLHAEDREWLESERERSQLLPDLEEKWEVVHRQRELADRLNRQRLPNNVAQDFKLQDGTIIRRATFERNVGTLIFLKGMDGQEIKRRLRDFTRESADRIRQQIGPR